MWGSTHVHVLLLLSCAPALEHNIEECDEDKWTNRRLTTEVKALKETVEALSESIATPQDEIFYQARLRYDTSYHDDETIIFDDVQVNKGDAYQNGVFTAPVKGVYFLWAHITRRDRCYVAVEIKSSTKGTLLKGQHIGDPYTCDRSSIWGLSTLEKGECIWVTKTAHKITTVRGERFSSAGATLIKAW